MWYVLCSVSHAGCCGLKSVLSAYGLVQRSWGQGRQCPKLAGHSSGCDRSQELLQVFYQQGPGLASLADLQCPGRNCQAELLHTGATRTSQEQDAGGPGSLKPRWTARPWPPAGASGPWCWQLCASRVGTGAGHSCPRGWRGCGCSSFRTQESARSPATASLPEQSDPRC